MPNTVKSGLQNPPTRQDEIGFTKPSYKRILNIYLTIFNCPHLVVSLPFELTASEPSNFKVPRFAESSGFNPFQHINTIPPFFFKVFSAFFIPGCKSDFGSLTDFFICEPLKRHCHLVNHATLAQFGCRNNGNLGFRQIRIFLSTRIR